MTVADAPSVTPPTPETCDHPAPVTGILAHEFAHYEGAIGPEGLRRTVTYYGPIVGGLPIRAWHCEKCGLLRLTYPDGRTEERRLYPGPQPGLLAEASPVATERVHYGMQARVSGLSAQPAFMDQLTGGESIVRPIQFPTVTLPAWDAITWLTVLGMISVLVGLLFAGLFAALSYSTPSVELPLVLTIVFIFVAVIALRLIVVAIRHFAPADKLSPSVAETMRGTPELDAATRAVVVLLVVCVMGLFASAVLATYTYSTPGAELPVVVRQPLERDRRRGDQGCFRHRPSLHRPLAALARASMPLHAPPDQDIVIVGATGDLAQRKLIPALYNLHRQKLLPAKGEIIGAAPFDWDDQRFRDLAESAVKQFSRTPLRTIDLRVIRQATPLRTAPARR